MIVLKYIDIKRRFKVNNTNIVLHKQYATYQTCLEIFSKDINNLDVYKKVFLYVIEWLKGRIGQSSDEIPELNIYPEVNDYKDFSLDSIKNLVLQSSLDIRLFKVEQSHSWALRIIEPDNRSEFKNKSASDGDDIIDRYFMTEVGLYENEDSVTMAVQILCKERAANKRDAIPYRPAFIKKIFKDKAFEMVENGVDREFRLKKEYDENGYFKVLPIIIDKSNGKRFMEKMFLNPKRQMPIIICPESVKDMKYKDYRYIRGEKTEVEIDITDYARTLIGYAHVVIIDSDVQASLFNREECKCNEYGEKLLANYAIFHSGIDEETLLPDAPIYYALFDENAKDEEESSENKEFEGKDALISMESLSKVYSVRKNYDFKPAAFYRELKKQQFELDGEKYTKDVVKNLEHDNREKDETIYDLNSKLNRSTKEYEARIKTLKDKYNNSQLSLEKYKKENKEISDKLGAKEQEEAKLKAEYEDKLRAKDLTIQSLSESEIPEIKEERMSKIYSSEQRILFKCQAEYKGTGIIGFLREALMKKFMNEYLKLKPEYRRFELLEIVLQYNKYLIDNGFKMEELLYYPTGFELYDTEFMDVIYDVAYGMIDEIGELGKVVEDLLDYNDFNYEQDTKKSELRNELNNYRQHKQIKGTLEKVGLVLVSSKGHYIYKYYNDERYSITASCTPSDGNSGKNLANLIIDKCL